MPTLKNKILKISLLFGVIAGVACFLFFLSLYASNQNPLLHRRPDIGINILFIFLAIWIYKNQHKGFLHFYEGFSIGFLTNLVAAFVTGSLLYIFIKWIDPKPFTTWISAGKQFIIDRRKDLSAILNEESFKLQLEAFDKAKPIQILFDDLMFKQFALIAIMLISMALRKQGDAIS